MFSFYCVVDCMSRSPIVPSHRDMRNPTRYWINERVREVKKVILVGIKIILYDFLFLSLRTVTGSVRLWFLSNVVQNRTKSICSFVSGE